MTKTEMAEKVAGSATLQILARLSMLATPFLIGAVMYFGGQWLDGRFNEVNAMGPRLSAAESAIVALQSHQMVTDSSSANAKADRLAFQQTTTQQLNAVVTDQRVMSNDIASIKATIDAIKGRLIVGMAGPP